jgi:hypothetical protein
MPRVPNPYILTSGGVDANNQNRRTAPGTKYVEGFGGLWAVIMAIFGVCIVFSLSAIVLGILKRIGGPLKADVQVTINTPFGAVTLNGVGLLACFLAIAILAFAGLYLITFLLRG